MNSALYVGRVQHRRFAVANNAFRYRIFQPFLDLAELDRVFDRRWFWSVNRRNLAEFRRSDYFGDAAREVYRDSDGRNHARNAAVHVATYQTLGVDKDGADESFLSEHYPADHFSHIIIDECHRSAWGRWSEVLRRNPNAIHIGLTATPRKLEESKQASAEDHMRRVSAQGDMRPMAASREAMEALRRILDGRAAFYSKAEFHVDTSAQPLDETWAVLRRTVREALQLPG